MPTDSPAPTSFHRVDNGSTRGIGDGKPAGQGGGKPRGTGDGKPRGTGDGKPRGTGDGKSRGKARLLRVVVPAVLVLVWLTLAGIGGPFFGRIGEVSSNDPTTYLPSSAESTAVQEAQAGFFESDEIPAIVVAQSAGGSELTEEQIGEFTEVIESVTADAQAVGEASPPIPSEDGQALQVFVPIDADVEAGDTVDSLREGLKGTVDGIDVYVTGPAGFSADLTEAFAGIDGLLLIVAFAVVLVILLIVYRAVILPLLVLTSSLFALCVAVLVNWLLADAGLFLLNGQVQGILFILVIGAATDYGLLLTARYREELERSRDHVTALKSAWKGAVEPIIASGGTVIAGLLCLLLSDLESNRALGPVASVGILCAILAALTLLPSLLALFGRVAYWPRVPRYAGEEAQSEQAAARADQSLEQVVEGHGVYGRIGKYTVGHPRRIWVGVTLLLILGAAFFPTLKAEGVAQSDLILTASDARDGQEVLSEHFPGGSGTPAYILAPEEDAEEVAQTALDLEGVESVSLTANDDPAGQLSFQDGEFVGSIPDPSAPVAEPTVSEGKVLLQATLTDAYDSAAAQETVRELREAYGDDVQVGGNTATDVDTDDASIHDRNLIIPIVLAVITLILIALMRAIVAALMLVITTVLSFAAAMGVAALVFNHVLDLPGADPAVPLYGFVFLVALGIDYNIFLMTRVREESERHGTREGIIRGVALTGGVITSAGVVLAATFAALVVIPILFLLQLAFIVALGVLVDTFLVRTLQVPGIATELGRHLWWPRKLAADGHGGTAAAHKVVEHDRVAEDGADAAVSSAPTSERDSVRDAEPAMNRDAERSVDQDIEPTTEEEPAHGSPEAIEKAAEELGTGHGRRRKET
ncbi:MMPL family transporter [Brachybacterium sp. p3-SID957]|uniref:MMPL family transporter n=1 Tax=Brachybacterium sp. p3-SID957 TaxID=2916049 RepID=UPI00223BB67F|nr:MMPL family transporter [Brachybacterium sp. p3-SID957]MCT1776963.1 MMPL family transporter [Brachybacterium sp. p3-SID957]